MSGRTTSAPLGLFADVFTGFTSFVSHAGGPPAAVYLLSQNLAKNQYQATSVMVFWIINITKFVPYASLGMFTAETVFADMLLAPFAILGTWLGGLTQRIGVLRDQLCSACAVR